MDSTSIAGSGLPSDNFDLVSMFEGQAGKSHRMEDVNGTVNEAGCIKVEICQSDRCCEVYSQCHNMTMQLTHLLHPYRSQRRS